MTAVQHERAPRSCVPNSHLTGGLSAVHRAFSPIQHMPFPHHQYHNGLILPVPLHMSSAFTTLDTQLPRHYPHLSAFDSLHSFAAASNGGLLPPPPPPPLISANTTTLQTKSVLDLNPYLNRYVSSKSESELSPRRPSPFCVPTLLKSTKDIHGKEDEVSSSEEILPATTSSTAAPTATTTPINQEVIFESAAKLLFLAVRWSKTIPQFAQLNVNDQNLLLEESWPELFLIMSAQYGLQIESKQNTKKKIFFIIFLAFKTSFKLIFNNFV